MKNFWRLLLGAVLLASAAPRTKAAEPITIGFSIELTGGLAAVGKTGLLAFQIWAEDVNKKGGLLGRPVKLIYYDDQGNPANVPGLLHEAHRHRQGRPADFQLRHQPRGAGDADRNAKEQTVLRIVRPRGQFRIPLPEIFLDAGVRS